MWLRWCPAQLLTEEPCFWSHHPKGFICYGDKEVNGVQVGILHVLPGRHLCCHSSCFSCCKVFIGGGQSVWACGIPHQGSALFPWNDGHSSPVVCRQLWRCQMALDVMGSLLPPVSDLLRISFTPAWRGWHPLLNWQLTPWLSTLTAEVGSTWRQSKVKPHFNPDSFIVHSQAKRRDWESIQPCFCLLGGCGQQASTRIGI